MSDNVTESVTPMRARIAEEIRVQLARRRMSASELARKMGVTQPYISRRLTAETPLDVDDLAKIADALDVHIVDLLPRGTEGHLITTATTRAHAQPSPNVRLGEMVERPGLNGYPERTLTTASTRRTARLCLSAA